MKISGVVVLYNPNKQVINNIKSYINLIDKLYVLDNSPVPNNNSDIFKDKKIKYISNNSNKGIAYALNEGAKAAIKDKADWLLTMDQDSSFKEGSLEKMISFLNLIKDNKSLEEVLGFGYDKIGILSVLHRTEFNKEKEFTGISFPLVVMTSGNLINLDIYKKVGGFKDWLFIDSVDYDYCLNLQKHKYKVVQINTAELKHNLGNIERKKIFGKTIFITNHSAIRRYYITRNRHYLYDMYYKDFGECCLLELKWTKKELIKIWLFEKEKLEKTKNVIQGYLDYKRGKKYEK